MTSRRITLITTGGTIGSTISADSVNVSQGEKQLQQLIQQVCQRQGLALDVSAAFNKNSEDITPADWLRLIRHVEQAIVAGSQDIIITHGTDTMAYTATALALCFNQQAVKIVLTGSCYSLNHADSDVTANLLGAINSVTNPAISNGVYVSFLNVAGKIQITDALNVKPMAFDGQHFEGCYGRSVGTLAGNEGKFIRPQQASTKQDLNIRINPAAINAEQLQQVPHRVFQLLCYPGMDAVRLCSGMPPDSVVIIVPYHCGTGPTGPNEFSLLATIKQRADLTFIVSPVSASLVSPPYASTVALIKAGAIAFHDLQPHQLFTLLLLSAAAGTHPDEIFEQLQHLRLQLD